MIDTNLTVDQLMTRDVITLSIESFVDKAVEIFAEHQFHHIPVVVERRIVGIISREDVRRVEHYFSIYKLKESQDFNADFFYTLPVADIMTKQVAMLRPTDKVSVAAGIFRENLFRALPIVNERKEPVGILTTYDLLNYAYRVPLTLNE
ncbi:MAG: CBS domain-containing protein [Saprospiraceae bacterium]